MSTWPEHDLFVSTSTYGTSDENKMRQPSQPAKGFMFLTTQENPLSTGRMKTEVKAQKVQTKAQAAAKSLQSCPILQPHRWQTTRLPCPWDSPGNNTGVDCHFLLQLKKKKSPGAKSKISKGLSYHPGPLPGTDSLQNGRNSPNQASRLTPALLANHVRHSFWPDAKSSVLHFLSSFRQNFSEISELGRASQSPQANIGF